MMRRVYIASGFDNGPTAHHLSDKLAAYHRIETTVKWWELPLSLEKDQQTRSLIARNDLNGVRGADLVVALLKGDPGTFNSAQLGTHAEIGAACVLGVPIVLVSPTVTPGPFCVFHRHPGVIARLVTSNLDIIADFVNRAIPTTHGALVEFKVGPFQWKDDEPQTIIPRCTTCHEFVGPDHRCVR